MKEKLVLALLATLSLSACNENKDSSSSGGAITGEGTGRAYSVFGSIRPKADPAMIEQVKEEEAAAARERQAAIEKQLAAQKAAEGGYVDPSSRDLPSVNTDPISGTVQPNQGQPMQPDPTQTAWVPPAGNVPAAPSAPPQQAMGYGINYSSPGPGFVPPPPAVSVSGSVAPPPEMYNPYAGGYGNPYAQQYAAPPQQPAPSRPALFATGKKVESSDEEEEAPKKKEKNFVPITPTGMEPRSPYKQRDDLKALWKGALASSLSPVARDEKFADGLIKVDVALPGESTRGSLSVAQRTIDSLFKNATVNGKIVERVKKNQSELAQSYYRYLYSFNKFSLTQQNVAARKQEMELAESNSEKQRATTDLAQAQSDADAAKEDMRAAQSDLASIAGAAAARTVIGRVCGVAPSLESLQIAETPPADAQAGQQNNALGGFFSAFGFGGGNKAPKGEPEAVVAKSEPKDKSKDKSKQKDNKDKDKKKEKGGKAPVQVAQNEEKEPAKPQTIAVESAAVSPAPQGAVSFELKDVKTTPRKSTLTVSIRNAGGDSFSFDSDAISVSEGNSKLADAAVRAEFDTTIVQPNQEVKGTITIFGRPWNDKLTVSLPSEGGGRAIPLHR